MLYQSLTSDLTFSKAFDLWMENHKIRNNGKATDASYLAPRTIKDYENCGKSLAKFFGNMRLDAIHLGHLSEYQLSRAICDKSAGDWAQPCGANRIRKEIVLLIRILRAARLWTDADKEHFKPLRRVEHDVPRAMTPEEQHRFLHLAASREEWNFIFHYSVLALQTTAATNELRSLRLGDIFLREGYLNIRRESAKNKYRIRTIPLVTSEVAFSIERLAERARALGSVAPHHYLFPIQEGRGGTRGSYDPTKPMSDSGLKKRWDAVRRAAGMPWLRPYDLRHTAITRMAEAGTPIQVIMGMAGHMTLRMQQHYTAISMSAKRGWAQASFFPAVVPHATTKQGVSNAARVKPVPAQTTPIFAAPKPVVRVGDGWGRIKTATWEL